jgi:hypothetical protein
VSLQRDQFSPLRLELLLSSVRAVDEIAKKNKNVHITYVLSKVRFCQHSPMFWTHIASWRASQPKDAAKWKGETGRIGELDWAFQEHESTSWVRAQSVCDVQASHC